MKHFGESAALSQRIKLKDDQEALAAVTMNQI